MDIVLANPRGFCAGVDRAIEIVNRALENFGAPIYVRHEVVHNRFVVDDLRSRGAVFVEDLDAIPDNSIVIFSAHGVSQAVRQEAERRGLKIFDATCPLVTKVHMEVARHCRAGRDVVLIGHAGHPEVEGTMGQWQRDAGRGQIYLVESVEDAVRERAERCELVLVVGSVTSSNSNRVRELAEKQGARAYLIDGAEDIQAEWLAGCARIGVTAGASAPEVLVKGVIARLQALGAGKVEELSGVTESMVFALPKELRVAVQVSS